MYGWGKIIYIFSALLFVSIFAVIAGITGCAQTPTLQNRGLTINIAPNQHFFQQNDKPFFWLGDTAWLLFKKLDRQAAAEYLENRRQLGFNVIQVMLLHTVAVKNFQGDTALLNNNVATPNITEGSDPLDPHQYDYWDHVDYVVDLAAKKNMFLALVPVWGTPVTKDQVNAEQAAEYARFLAERYKNKPNIIWLNGGDTYGDKYTQVWQTIGSTLEAFDPDHLKTFHPRGSHMSSKWFHNEPWLDFNMFQSGHRAYGQKPRKNSYPFGPDNWKYVELDYPKTPIKPTLDGEPSYEEIPHGLHDTTLPYWNSNDVRRYGYWSVFSGAAGYTYGHNSIMQFYRPEDGDDKAFGVKSYWRDALHAEGASQMQHLKALILSNSGFDRIPAQDLIGNQGEKYNHLVATRGDGYAMVYTYTGRNINLRMGQLPSGNYSVHWFNPRTGILTESNQYKRIQSGNRQVVFNPPGEPAEGHDWVLVLKALTH